MNLRVVVPMIINISLRKVIKEKKRKPLITVIHFEHFESIEKSAILLDY